MRAIELGPKYAVSDSPGVSSSRLNRAMVILDELNLQGRKEQRKKENKLDTDNLIMLKDAKKNNKIMKESAKDSFRSISVGANLKLSPSHWERIIWNDLPANP